MAHTARLITLSLLWWAAGAAAADLLPDRPHLYVHGVEDPDITAAVADARQRAARLADARTSIESEAAHARQVD